MVEPKWLESLTVTKKEEYGTLMLWYFRSRRRRARDARSIRDHQEGMSTDEEESNSETTRFLTEQGKLNHTKTNAVYPQACKKSSDLRNFTNSNANLTLGDICSDPVKTG